MKVQFHPAAASEHFDSVAFYESRLAGLGADYLAEFDATLVRICNAPISFPLETPPDIRIARLKRSLLTCSSVPAHRCYWYSRSRTSAVVPNIGLAALQWQHDES